jgi:hypothetical protein
MVSLLLGVLLFFFPNFLQDTLKIDRDIHVHSFLTESQKLTISEDFQVTHIKELNLVINSSEGLNHATTILQYDRLSEIISFELEVIDPVSRKVIQKAKLKDMGDFAAYSMMSIFDDNRYKLYELRSGKFPIQVIIKTETKAKTNFFLPTWIPVHHYNQKVVSSTLEIEFPTTQGLRFKELNLLGEKNGRVTEGKSIRTWVEKDLPIQERDLKEEDDHRLLLAPVNFGLENFAGTMDTWSGLGSFLSQLNQNRNDLSPEFKKEIQLMTANAERNFEKIEILYEYLQRNYRYVSIQLGIGGWQSMKTADVVKYAYGDCKALTFLMQSMLAEVGIPANYTLVYAGEKEDDIEVDFPSNQFNHVILQAFDGDQPVWLECTSNSLPAGYLGDFTKNRHVLVANDTGGYLTKTPDYLGQEWNTASTKSTILIDAQGNASIESSIAYQGNPAGDLIQLKSQMDSRQQRDYFNRNSPVSGLIIEDFSFELDRKDSIPVAAVSYQGFIQKFTQNTAKRLILKPFFDKISLGSQEMESLYIKDEYQIKLVEPMELEFELADQLFDEKGLSVSLKSVLEGTELRVEREVRFVAGEEMDKDAKSELIRKANATFNKPYIFIKPTNTPH